MQKDDFSEVSDESFKSNADLGESDSNESNESNENLGDSNECDSSESNADSAESSVDSDDSSESNADKIKALEEKYIRAYAEFDNVKKRLEREKYLALEYANEQILKDFLPILDTLESALDSTKNDDSEAVAKIREGIQLTIDNFIKAFNKHNVSHISTDGEFDPNVHNAIMQVPSADKKDGEIAQVIQKGYKYKDRVIRPSMVAITKN
ncbi:nucleotide exchange factor GrpE [Helicobacter sp. 23-1045]